MAIPSRVGAWAEPESDPKIEPLLYFTIMERTLWFVKE